MHYKLLGKDTGLRVSQLSRRSLEQFNAPVDTVA
jgi:hypothetical protein